MTTRSQGSEVLTAVIMKSFVFWHITLCSPLKVNRLFGETCRLHLFRVEEQVKQETSINEDRGDVPPKRRLNFN
jgi:hypothetical protein